MLRDKQKRFWHQFSKWVVVFDYVNLSGPIILTTAILCKNRKLTLEIIKRSCDTDFESDVWRSPLGEEIKTCISFDVHKHQSRLRQQLSGSTQSSSPIRSKGPYCDKNSKQAQKKPRRH